MIESQIICTRGINLKRKLFNLAAIVSMLLCIGFTVLWIRSYVCADHIRIKQAWISLPDSYYLRWFVGGSNRGVIAISILQTDFFPNQSVKGFPGPMIDDEVTRLQMNFHSGWEIETTTQDSSGISSGWLYAVPHGKHDSSSNPRRRDVRWGLTVPAPYLVVILSILPVRWLNLKRQESKRLRIGLCQTCGYDLRATPERCPECGTVVSEIKPKGKPA